MEKSMKNLLRDDRGATLVEYGLLLLLIAVAAIASLTLFGGAINNMYTNEANDL
jgi:pilus assembly protein Flp/PilA